MNFRFPAAIIAISLLAASSIGACGSDSDAPPGGTGGAPASGCNNNSMVEGAEQCDGANFNGKTCQSVLMNASATGQLSCSNCTLVTTGCMVPGGGGGATGTGGASTGTGGI
jgi:hypothetical protein